jgi:D-alanyl-D-alanine carboxypeptidase
MMHRIKCQLILYAVLSALLSACFGPASAPDEIPISEQFQQELNALHDQYPFPGATAAFILPDGTLGQAAAGLADIERQLKMAPQSRMLAASIGKTFVGATVLGLAHEKLLMLDEPIATWLSDHPWFTRLPNHDSITLRQLLNHTAGLPNHLESEQFAMDFREGKFSGDVPPSPEELIAYILDQPALFRPGQGWYYSDTGYLLVGLIIRRVTGRSFYKEVSRRFLQPLQLSMTTPSNQRKIPGLAAGYMDASNPFGLPPKTTLRPGIMAWHPGIEGAGGGFVSNPKDLVVWAQRLFEGKAMEGDYLDDLLRAVPLSEEAPNVQYGMAVGIHRKGPFGKSYGHGGWIPGYSSSLRYYPEHGVAVAFQINTDIGIVNDSIPLMEDMEHRLTRIVIASIKA